MRVPWTNGSRWGVAVRPVMDDFKGIMTSQGRGGGTDQARVISVEPYSIFNY